MSIESMSGDELLAEVYRLRGLLGERDAEIERLRAGREIEREMLRSALPIIAENDSLRASLAAASELLDTPIGEDDECTITRDDLRAALEPRA